MTYLEAKKAYDDLICLNDTGCWPNNVEPKWAVEMGKKLEVHSANPAVVSNGWKAVARAFYTELAYLGPSTTFD